MLFAQSPQSANLSLVQQVAAFSNLGSFIAYYRRSKVRAFLVSFALLFFGLLLTFLVLSGFGISFHPPTVLVGIVWVLLFGITALGFLHASIISLLRRNEHVTIYDQGLVHGIGLQQHQYHVVRWDEVETVSTNGNEKGGQIILRPQNGKQISIRVNLQQKLPPSPAISLVRLVEERFIAWHIQGALSQLRSGQELNFGNLFLSWQGIRTSKTFLSWRDIAKMEIRVLTDDDRSFKALVMYPVGGNFWQRTSFRLEDFPNYCLFHELVIRYIGFPIT